MLTNKEIINKGEIHTFKYIFNNILIDEKMYLFILLSASMIQAFIPISSTIFPKIILDSLSVDKGMNPYFIGILLTLLIALIYAGNKYLNYQVLRHNRLFKTKMDKKVDMKIMTLPYEFLEQAEILDLKEQAIWTFENYGGISYFIKYLIDIIAYSIAIISLTIIIVSLDKKLIMLILLTTILSYLVNLKISENEFNKWEKNTPLNRRYLYLVNMSANFSYGKDMRLFNGSEMVRNQMENLKADWFKLDTYVNRKNFKYKMIQTGINIILIFITLSFLLIKTSKNNINISSFVMYAMAIIQFPIMIDLILNAVVGFRQMCKHGANYVEFMELGNEMTNKNEVIEPKQLETIIEFIDVSFSYPGSKEYVLKDISFKIEKNKKISLVGRNGSGKTTLIKLLCRLYTPSKGKILLYGKDIEDYAFDEYIKLLSVVFQDYKLFNFTIKENIVLSEAGLEEEDIIRVRDSLEKVELLDKVNTLPHNIDTIIGKQFDKDGTIFSGGQNQRLAIARALYKDAEIFILDEPSASLDPVAEEQIFKQINSITDDKTSILISHRMSSCQYCDEIYVLKEGELVEKGTHDSLLESSGSHYAELYSAQAQFYMNKI